MTTAVKITHEGGPMHDIEVVTADPITGEINSFTYRMAAGNSVTLFAIEATQGIAIREVPAQHAITEAAAGGVGQVGVTITPHDPDVAESEGGEV